MGTDQSPSFISETQVSFWIALPNIHTNCKYSVGHTDCQHIFFKISYSTGLYATDPAYPYLLPVLRLGCILRFPCRRRNAFAGYPLSLDYGPMHKEPAGTKYIDRTRERVNTILLNRGILFTLFAKEVKFTVD